MKIEPTRGVTGAVRGTTVSRIGRPEKKSGPKPTPPTQPDTSSALPDTVEILGIPEAELTPKVRDALMSLMADVADLRREVAAARDHMAHLERMADQDVLVPVANRRAFVRELSRAIAATERYGAKAAVVYFDVNGFKTINDNLGHAAGDAALHHIAKILSASVRETDTVGRLGGDEFGVILSHSEDEETKDKAKALVDAIHAAPFIWDGEAIDVQVAFGAYSFQPGENADDALAAADRAMYAHKKGMKKAG